MDSTWRDEPQRYDRMLGGFGGQLLAAAGLRAGDRVLDVGPGASDQPIELARRVGAAGRVVAVEIDAELAAVGRRRAVAAGFPDVEHVVADIAAAPLEPEGFDVVVSRFALMMTDPAVTFPRLAAALTPGARLVATVWQTAARNAWFTLPLEILADVVPGFGAPPDAPPFRLADDAAVARHLADGGFVDVRVDALVQPVWLGADVDDVIGFLERGAGDLRAAFDDEMWSRVRDAAKRRLTPYDGADGLRVPAAAWLVTARRA